METLAKEEGINSFKFFLAYKGALAIPEDDMLHALRKCKELGALPMVRPLAVLPCMHVLKGLMCVHLPTAHNATVQRLSASPDMRFASSALLCRWHAHARPRPVNPGLAF